MAINLHEGQSEILEALFIERLYRYAVACCSRGWGKSFFAAVAAMTAIFELLQLKRDVPHKYVYIIAPTYDQVTDIYYPIINYELGVSEFCLKSSKDTGRFIFDKNVELRLISYESIERMRGKGSYFTVWDEVSSCRKGIKPSAAWQGIIQPCLTTRWSPKRAAHFGAISPGRALIIGTPKGYNFFAELLNYQDSNPAWNSYHYDYTKSPFLDPIEIEALKFELDPIEYASEYMASVAESGKNVFYCFDRKMHVDPTIEDLALPVYDANEVLEEPGEDVHFCIDFNVGLQCTSIWAIRGDQQECIDEVKGHPDTETLAISLSTRYKGHKMFAYPDPSGKARKTSASVGVTDFTILQQYGIIVLAKSKAPPIVDSVNAVNRRLMTAAGEVSMRFHPRAKNTITSMERTKWVDNNQDTATIDKSESIEHYSDGVRYFSEFRYPIRKTTSRVAQSENF